MSSLARRTVLVIAAALTLSGCTDTGAAVVNASGDPPSTRLSASGPGPAPSPTESQPPGTAPTSPEQAVHVIALSAADLPSAWTVAESPTDGNIENDPTFLGLCGFDFHSERRRTAKVPVTGLNPDGVAVLTTEAVSYDQSDGAALALTELRTAYQGCPPDQTFTDVPPIDQSGLAEDRVVVEYTLAEDVQQTVVVQRRGSLLSVILGEARLITLDAARKIFQRMSALSPEAAGEV